MQLRRPVRPLVIGLPLAALAAVAAIGATQAPSAPDATGDPLIAGFKSTYAASVSGGRAARRTNRRGKSHESPASVARRATEVG